MRDIKAANNAWSACVSEKFLPKWLDGADISIESVCQREATKMKTLAADYYAEDVFKMPFPKKFDE